MCVTCMILLYLVVAENEDKISNEKMEKLSAGKRKVFFLLPLRVGVKCADYQHNGGRKHCLQFSLLSEKHFPLNFPNFTHVCDTMCMVPRYSTLFELSFLSDEFSSWNFYQFMRKKKVFTLNFS